MTSIDRLAAILVRIPRQELPRIAKEFLISILGTWKEKTSSESTSYDKAPNKARSPYLP